MKHPTKGDVLVGGGGIRKARWNLNGMGKSGSIRIIYYYKVVRNRIYLLLAYRKNRKENLSEAETRILRELVKELDNE